MIGSNELVRMMKFLSETCEDVSTSSADRGLHDIEWCLDASFAAHANFKSHAGACQAFEGGKGAVQSVSAKQKLNTSSLMTSELVGADHALPLALWMPPLVEAQGHHICKNKVWQDNQSIIPLGKNGKASSGKRTRV